MEIEIYSGTTCGWCDRAKTLMNENGLTYIEIEVTPENAKELVEKIAAARGLGENSVRLTIPQIFVDDKLIGGYEDLAQWVNER